MSKIKSLLIKDASTWVDFPDIDGFKVKLNYVSRETLVKIRNASLVFKFNRKTHNREEEVDTDKLNDNYAKEAITGWKGLKVKHLAMIMPVDISGMNPEEEIPYTHEDAVDLLKNSTVFDQFISESMNDFEQFSKREQETAAKN